MSNFQTLFYHNLFFIYLSTRKDVFKYGHFLMSKILLELFNEASPSFWDHWK